MREPTPSQKTRFVLLFLEVGILCAASWLAFGKLFPANDDKGFWFYTALLGLLIGSRLDAPFFARPSDVFRYAAPAAIALALVNSWAQWNEGVRVAYSVAVTFCVVAGLLGAIAILTVNSKSGGWQKASNAARILAETLGSPRTIYTVVIGFALYAFHRSSPKEFGIIVAAWVLTGVLSPLEGVLRIARRLRRIFKPTMIFDADGEVVAYQTPGLILVRQSGSGKLEPGDLVAVQDPLGKTRLALALDHVGRDEGVLLRTMEIPDAEVADELREQLSALTSNAVVRISADETLSQNLLVKAKATLIGLVAPDTSVERLFFEVVKNEGLEEGRLVEVQIGKRLVTYQLVNGLTKEEVVQQKNTYGFARAQAQKIGEWNTLSKRFAFVKWLPAPNAPVLLKTAADFVPSSSAIGHFPGTDYPVSIKSINELVTHNTAILGILGVGKSMLAIELVERMMANGVKVICLDLTNQYAQELASYYDEAHEVACLTRIQEAGEKDREAWAENPEEGGSIPALREAFQTDLVEFLREDNPRRLKIYNPSQVVGSKQLNEPKQFQTRGQWQRGAALWGVTSVEVTRIVSETVLAILQDRMSSEARACLVYEEAHSLIPEFSSVAAPSDREATNGTARAILQGRKFGLGCLVVTQRTANVTKTILNQCNTVFAMRTFDETGKEFLANYVGKDYAASLSSISERHAVLFGKASSCENPILIRLNDRERFLEAFRAENPPPQLPTADTTPKPA